MRTNTMKAAHWSEVDKLAAELTVLHQADINVLQKTMHYIRGQQPSYDKLLEWLDAQIRAAAFFPRSNQTLRYQVIVKAVVEHIGESGIQQPDDIALMLGWITRLMRHYKSKLNEARTMVDKAHPYLNVPPSPTITLRNPPRQQDSTDIPEPPKSEDEVSQAAKDFMSFLLRRKDQSE